MSVKIETAIVTGASTGLGLAITKAFLDNGINVVMNSVNPDNLKAAHQSLGSPSNAVLVAGDVSDKGVGGQLTAAAVENFGGVDVLVNNAGIFSPKPFLDTEEADLDRFFAVNFKGTYFASQAVVPEMKKRGGGAIINIGTTLAIHAIGGFPATAVIASKAAVHSLAEQLGAELGKDNIRVNTISPGIIDTPIHAKNGIDDSSSLAGLHLLNRIGASEDVAEAVLMLATNDFITGANLRIDGGHSAGHHLG
jgi:NAD(P)-dependent dehydrogenase (short-subunit alcohol dehydrogenase family)